MKKKNYSHYKNIVMLAALSLTLSACGTFFDKDNTPPPSPLVTFTPETAVHPVWSTSTGPGTGNEYLKLSPVIFGNQIFTASKNGIVTATDKTSGQINWRVNTNTEITGGVGTNGELVFAGTRNGQVLALRQTDGTLVWKAQVSSEILAPTTGTRSTVLAKSIDGNLTALAANDGHTLWQYQQTEPSLILRGSSAPQITSNTAIVGFENGNLAKLTLSNGDVLWQQTIAYPNGIFAIERMVDIDADPIILGNRVYAATYQGRIAALSLGSGNELWNHDISSYAGIAADNSRVYVSDAKSHLWAFDADSGAVDWRQNDLAARNITGPASFGRYVVVGDAEGYLHWISKQDGHFAARVFVNRSGILATPIVSDNTLYVYTKDGRLAAYTLG